MGDYIKKIICEFDKVYWRGNFQIEMNNYCYKNILFYNYQEHFYLKF